ncbi:MAG: hypothetical protein GAK43_01972 [Stenotrophomonas maltophilia]|nr:MAG: hypothetical protein GAK43_01972 [Stenotrophomonas maltophilia]
MSITCQDLARAVAAGILQPGQDQRLLAFLETQNPERPSFQLAHVAYYFGAVLIIAAMGWLLTEAWMNIGDIALLLIAVVYMGLFTLTGLNLWKRNLQIPGGLLGAVAVSLTPLLVFALQRLTGFWADDDAQTRYHNYYLWVNSAWLLMEAATLLVGLAMLRLLPFPFIVMPMAIALWFMSMDLTEVIYGTAFGWEDRRLISVWFGLAVILGSLLVDGRTQRDYAFWGYLAGLAAFWGGLSLMDSGSEWGKAGYGVINLGLMGLAIVLRRPLFMVFGAFGVAGYLGYLSYDVFSDSLLFPVVLTFIGLGLIAIGIAYQKRRQHLTERLRAGLPTSLLSFLPALRR